MNLIIFLATFCIMLYYDEIKEKITGEKRERPKTDYEPPNLVVAKIVSMVLSIDAIFGFLAFVIGKYIYFNIRPIFKWITHQPEYMLQIAILAAIVFSAWFGKLVARKFNSAENEDDILNAFAIFNLPFMLMVPILTFYIGHAISFFPKK